MQGDAVAQYALAAALTQAGARAEAAKWLAKSAAQEYPEALYTIASQKIGVRSGIPEALALLNRAAALGASAQARRLAASLTLFEDGDVSDARDYLIGAAMSGDVIAQRDVAMLLLAGDPHDISGAQLLHMAAQKDGVAAAVYVANTAAGAPHMDHSLAVSLVNRLSQTKYPNTDGLERRLRECNQRKHAPGQYTAFDWSCVSEKVFDFDSSPVCAELSISPSIKQYKAAFTPAECEYVIAQSIRLLAPSQIVDPATGVARADTYRSSYTAIFGAGDGDPFLQVLSRRLATLTGCAHRCGEFLSVLYYRPGQQYLPHFDWLPPGNDLERGGQRAATALIYLNEEYEGGGTYFETPNLEVAAMIGNVVVFENIDENGQPDQRTRHTGRPVKTGAKWLASRWMRVQNYNF